MTGVSLGLRTGSYGSLQLVQNGGVLQGLPRRPSKALLYKEKERVCPLICRQLGRGKVAMLLMFALGFSVFVFGCFTLYNACPVCYIPVEQAIASMPSLPSESPVIRSLTYVHDENPVQREPHGGSDFGGYPSVQERNAAFDIKENMTVHCGKL